MELHQYQTGTKMMKMALIELTYREERSIISSVAFFLVLCSVAMALTKPQSNLVWLYYAPIIIIFFLIAKGKVGLVKYD